MPVGASAYFRINAGRPDQLEWIFEFAFLAQPIKIVITWIGAQDGFRAASKVAILGLYRFGPSGADLTFATRLAASSESEC